MNIPQKRLQNNNNTICLRISVYDIFVLRPMLRPCIYLRNEFNFWNVHGTMNTSGLLQSKLSPYGFTLTLQETRSIRDSMNILKIGFIAYVYILLQMSKI